MLEVCLKKRAATAELLTVRVANQQGLDLANQVSGAKRLDKHGLWVLGAVAMIAAGIFAEWGIGSQNRGSGVVALPARGADHFQARLLGFHVQVADHHVIVARLQMANRFGCVGGRFYFEIMEFQHGFQGQQNREVVIDEKDAPFHSHVTIDYAMQYTCDIADGSSIASRPLG